MSSRTLRLCRASIALVVAFIVVLTSSVIAFASDGTFESKFGIGQLSGPSEVALDSSGNAYVADTNNNRIKKFSSAGVLIATYGAAGSGTPAVGGTPQFNLPRDIELDASGNMYVVDMSNNRIQKLSSTGTFLQAWTGLSAPRGIASDSAGNFYVSNAGVNQIRKYDSGGALIGQWGGPAASSANGQFDLPVGIAVQGASVFVADYNNHRVQKFTTSGAYVSKWGTLGSADGQFSFPTGIAVDSSGAVYVADRNNVRIQKFDSSGAFLLKWGSAGTGDGEFSTANNGVRGVTAAPGGRVYVADYGNNRIQVFGSTAPPPPVVSTPASSLWSLGVLLVLAGGYVAWRNRRLEAV